MRHAKAEPAAAGTRDIDRPLSLRGRAVAPLMGRYIAAQALAPDRVLVSTARRTRETWEALAPALRGSPAFAYEPRLYEAAPKALLALLREVPREVQTALLIGHNPGVQELAALLAGSGDDEARLRLREKFPTAALAVLDFPLDDWGGLKPSSGRLDRFVTPRMLPADGE